MYIRHMENHGCGWSIQNDIRSLEDISIITKVLIPCNQNAKDPLWHNGEVIAVEGLIKFWWLETDRSNKELARVASMSQQQIADILKVMPECSDAYGLLCNPKNNTSYSFYVSILTDLKPLRLLGKTEGTFSIIDWLCNDRGGKIYLPMNDKAEAMLSPLYAMFIELVMLNHMELPQDRERRIWYFLDELPNLPKLTQLTKLITKAPSYGCAIVSGTQSLAALDEKYGELGRRSIMNASALCLIFAVEDDQTAEAMSKRIGIADIEKASENLSTASNESKDGVTSMLKIEKENVVTPDEIKNLKPLNLYLRIAGFGSCKLKLKYKPYKQINAAYIQNPIYSLETFEAEHRALIEVSKLTFLGHEPEKATEAVQEQDILIDDGDELLLQATQLIHDNDIGHSR